MYAFFIWQYNDGVLYVGRKGTLLPATDHGFFTSKIEAFAFALGLGVLPQDFVFRNYFDN